MQTASALTALAAPPRTTQAPICVRDLGVVTGAERALPARGQRPGGVCCRTKDRNSYSACCSEILLSFTALVRPDCKKRAARHRSATRRRQRRFQKRSTAKAPPFGCRSLPSVPRAPPEPAVSAIRDIPALLPPGSSPGRPERHAGNADVPLGGSGVWDPGEQDLPLCSRRGVRLPSTERSV